MINLNEKKIRFEIPYVEGTFIKKSFKNKNLFYDLLKRKTEVIKILYCKTLKTYLITFKGEIEDEECQNIIKEIETIVGYRKTPVLTKENYEINDWFLVSRDKYSKGIYGYYLENALTKEKKYLSRNRVSTFFKKNNCVNGIVQPSRNLIISKQGKIPKSTV